MKDYFILKTHCRRIFLLGSGNFWYEHNTSRDDKKLLYIIYTFILFFTYGYMTVLEIIAAVIGTYPEDEKRDSISFAVSHTIVMIKLFSVIRNKVFIRELNRKIVNICEKYEDQSLMAEKYYIIKINVIAYYVTVYGSAACFVFEGLRKLHEGIHFVTVVTYYPAYENNTPPATAFRVFTTAVLFLMLMSMIVTVDSFTMIYLIIYKYKFITLRQYFENLKEQFDRLKMQGNEELAAEKLAKGLVEGIEMHGNLLRLSKDIDKAFGTVMTLQLCQSSGSAVSLLLQIALSNELTFVAGMKVIFFVAALFFLLGLFLCNAGEITYQGPSSSLLLLAIGQRACSCAGLKDLKISFVATLLSDAIFYCGWHLCRSRVSGRRNIRKMVLFAIMQARQPLVMKAFKMLELSYATFILVLRGTYSVFALFYAQNK